ncbi:hypothetical protein [Nocardioides sp. SYSU DS0663]|uniref:hypothetical protein n=1 Tax=Nocardioides sp. SYSU DS0663 TaxID=3416445 RepID=UPI003F4B1B89
MTEETSGNRRASYLIAAAILFLIVIVGAAYFIIAAVRGTEADGEDLGPDSPAPQIVTGLVADVVTGPVQ